MSQHKRRRSERKPQRYLGDEVVEQDILSRLPAKSLLRFMCVCKSWHSLISSPCFISSQLRNCNNTQALLHQCDMCDGRPASVRLLHLEDNRHQKLSLDFGFESVDVNLEVIGSARGLICYLGVQVNQYIISKFVIFNPEIGSFVSVAPPLPSFGCTGILKGFGFDDTTLDYKIMLAKQNSCVYIYSLNSKFWKYISCQIPWGVTAGDCAMFAKDCFHWLTYEIYFQEAFEMGTYPDHDPSVLVFDIKRETFRRILFPERLLGRLRIIPGFDESSIGAVQTLVGERTTITHVWLMHQNDLWFKVADDVKVDRCSEGKRVLGFRNKDELIIRLNNLRRVIVFQNIENKVVHDVMISVEPQWCFGFRVHTHVPSLALLR